jgi:tRNA 2-thiouridine synthesizing protein A
VTGTTLIDARGLRCPWPVLRLARALRDGAELVEMMSDDPAARGEVASFATQRGLKIVVSDDCAGSARFIIGG